MAKVSQKFDIQKEYATKVAQNLYNYMLSFEERTYIDQFGRQSEVTAVPTDIFERWHQKFLKKYEMDNNFILNTKD